MTAMAISPDGVWLATSGQDGVVKLWNRSREVAFQTADRITGLAWLADGSALCAGGPLGVYVLGRPRLAATHSPTSEVRPVSEE